MIVKPASWTQALPLDTLYDRPARLEVDVGCGKGRFLLARAQAHPDVNFLGIDRQLGRLRKIEKRLERHGIANVRLLQIEASYAIRFLLAETRVDTFYVFFPDPWPKRRHHGRRLFVPSFLDDLDRTLKPGGHVHVATDHLDYFDSIHNLLKQDPRFEPSPVFIPSEAEQTDFERIFLGQDKAIGRCSFKRRTAQHPMIRP